MKIRPALWLCLAFVVSAVTSGVAQEASASQKPKLRGFTIVSPARDANGSMLKPAAASANSALATFNYTTATLTLESWWGRIHSPLDRLLPPP